MTKKLKLRVAILLAAIASAALALFAGCTLGTTLDGVIKQYDLKATVTYYSNGGEFGKNVYTKTIHYHEGDYVYEITETDAGLSDGSANVTRTNYELSEWHYVSVDGEGNPVYNADGMPVDSGVPVDFTKPIQSGENWYVMAIWLAKVRVRVNLAADGFDIQYNNKTYSDGDFLKEFTYDSTGKVSDPGVKDTPLFGSASVDATFCDYYADAACTTPVTWPIEREEQDVIVYAKFIKGDWTILRTADDVSRNWANFSRAGNYYLNADIDCSGKSVSALTQFNCNLQGNGHAIFNLAVNKSQIGSGSIVSAFGKILQGAVISDLSLHFSATYSLKTNGSFITAYLIAESIAEGASVDLSVNARMTVTLTRESRITNIGLLPDGSYDGGNWLCGGFASNEEFLSAYGGVTVSDETSFEIIN